MFVLFLSAAMSSVSSAPNLAGVGLHYGFFVRHALAASAANRFFLRFKQKSPPWSGPQGLDPRGVL